MYTGLTRHGCRKRRVGHTLIELPMALWTLFIGIAIPMMCLASFGYRCIFAYYAVRDSCSAAARSPTFTTAQTNALNSFNRDLTVWNFVSGTETISIVTKPYSASPPTFSATKLPPGSVNISANMYFIREVAQTTIQPLINIGPSWGLTIPGLTAPFNMQYAVDVYVENPSGLTS